jgi:hypothetical protein
VRGLDDDLGDDTWVGDHRQVRRVYLGDAGARRAMVSCSAGGMTRSAVPTTAQDGMVSQAGTPDGWPSAMVDSGSCVAASRADALAENSDNAGIVRVAFDTGINSL